MATPRDMILYNLIKNKLFKKNSITSAYRSSQLVMQYKEAYKKKHGDTNYYKGNKPTKTGLIKWYNKK